MMTVIIALGEHETVVARPQYRYENVDDGPPKRVVDMALEIGNSTGNGVLAVTTRDQAVALARQILDHLGIAHSIPVDAPRFEDPPEPEPVWGEDEEPF